VTEQIERELAEMFHERAAQLDVLPPLPAARVRRARLQSAMAMASVVAVLAAGGVVGVRLAASPDGPSASIAGSGSAREALERVVEHMLTGRWRVTGTERIYEPNTADPPNSGGGAPMSFTVQVDYDGQSETGVARQDGEITAIQVGGVSYTPLHVPPDALAYLPKGARWHRTPFALFGQDPAAFVTGASAGASTLSGPSGSALGRGTSSELKGATVRRTSAGFRVDAAAPFGGSARTDIKLRPDGTIASIHTETRARIPNATNTGATNETAIMDAVFTPLTAPVDVAAPSPATIVTDVQLSAALQKAFRNGAPGSGPCPPSVATPSPAMTERRTTDGGSVTLPQTMPMLTCRQAIAVQPGHRAPAIPVTSPSPH